MHTCCARSEQCIPRAGVAVDKSIVFVGGNSSMQSMPAMVRSPGQEGGRRAGTVLSHGLHFPHGNQMAAYQHLTSHMPSMYRGDDRYITYCPLMQVCVCVCLPCSLAHGCVCNGCVCVSNDMRARCAPLEPAECDNVNQCLADNCMETIGVCACGEGVTTDGSMTQ